jgi:hypothetical protein
MPGGAFAGLRLGVDQGGAARLWSDLASPTTGRQTMDPPCVDIPLAVDRLSTEELFAATRAVATVVASRCLSSAAGGIAVEVTWCPASAGDSWLVGVREPPWEANLLSGALLGPIIRQIRPRALKYEFLSDADQATVGDWHAIGNAGTSPSASFYEKRWVANRTVAMARSDEIPAKDTVAHARAVLEAIYAKLDLAPPSEFSEAASP